jgi:hypothetical protein
MFCVPLKCWYALLALPRLTSSSSSRIDNQGAATPIPELLLDAETAETAENCNCLGHREHRGHRNGGRQSIDESAAFSARNFSIWLARQSAFYQTIETSLLFNQKKMRPPSPATHFQIDRQRDVVLCVFCGLCVRKQLQFSAFSAVSASNSSLNEQRSRSSPMTLLELLP